MCDSVAAYLVRIRAILFRPFRQTDHHVVVVVPSTDSILSLDWENQPRLTIEEFNL